MSNHTAPEPRQLTGDENGFTYYDTEVAGSEMSVVEDSLNPGGLNIEIHEQDAHGPSTDAMFLLPARDRMALAMQLLAGVPGVELSGAPVKNPAKYQVIVDTHTTFAESTPEGVNKLLQRLAWHLHNGIPAKVIEPEGGVFTINEVSEGEVPPRMSETRRHFRYQVPGDTEWHYHSNFKKITAEGGQNIQFQRTYKSEWENI